MLVIYVIGGAKMYNVEFSYDIVVEANTKKEAEIKACQKWDDIAPRKDEMNIEVSNYQDG